MSEKKPSDLILERLDQLEKMIKTTSTLKPELEERKLHGTIEEIEACPNCSEKFKLKDYNDEKRAEWEPSIAEKAREKAFKEFKEKLKSKELLTCDGCGEIVGKDEKECPTCHGHKAH